MSKNNDVIPKRKKADSRYRMEELQGLTRKVYKTGLSKRDIYDKVLADVETLYERRAKELPELKTNEMKKEFVQKTLDFFKREVFENKDNYLVIVKKNEEDLGYFLFIKHNTRLQHYWIRFFSHSLKYGNKLVSHILDYFTPEQLKSYYIYGYNHHLLDADLIEHYKKTKKVLPLFYDIIHFLINF